MNTATRLLIAALAFGSCMAVTPTGLAADQGTPKISGNSEARFAQSAIRRVQRQQAVGLSQLNQAPITVAKQLQKLEDLGVPPVQLTAIANNAKRSISAARLRLDTQVRAFTDGVVVQIERVERNAPIITSGVILSLRRGRTSEELIQLVIDARDQALAQFSEAEAQAIAGVDAALAAVLAP